MIKKILAVSFVAICIFLYLVPYKFYYISSKLEDKNNLTTEEKANILNSAEDLDTLAMMFKSPFIGEMTASMKVTALLLNKKNALAFQFITNNISGRFPPDVIDRIYSLAGSTALEEGDYKFAVSILSGYCNKNCSSTNMEILGISLVKSSFIEEGKDWLYQSCELKNQNACRYLKKASSDE